MPICLAENPRDGKVCPDGKKCPKKHLDTSIDKEYTRWLQAAASAKERDSKQQPFGKGKKKGKKS